MCKVDSMNDIGYRATLQCIVVCAFGTFHKQPSSAVSWELLTRLLHPGPRCSFVRDGLFAYAFAGRRLAGTWHDTESN